MKIKLEIVSDTFFEFLRNFESADAAYLAVQDEFINADPVNVDEMDVLNAKLKKASDYREHYAVVLSQFLSNCQNWVSFEADPDAPADAPEDSPVDTLEDVPEADSNSPADAPEDALEDASEVAPEDALEDASEVAPEDVVAADPDSPADAPEDSPVDTLEDVPETDSNSPADAPEDIFPVMSAKCRLCPSCVDGRCFFVPDIYDSEFPCQSSAWDNFFKSGGSHGPAP